MNENEELLVDFCAFNNMVIGGSIFHEKDIHKVTWRSPDHVTENQINHVCIGQKFRRSLQGVRVKRGEDASSDYHLVMAPLKLCLKRCPVQKNPRARYMYNMDQFKGGGGGGGGGGGRQQTGCASVSQTGSRPSKNCMRTAVQS